MPYMLLIVEPPEQRAIAAECPAAQWATVEVRATGPCDPSA